MTSATFAETPISREPAAERDHESASDHELSANDDSPPSTASRSPSKSLRKRSHDDSDRDEPDTEAAREDLRQTRISGREKSKSPKLKHNTTAANPGSPVDDKEIEDPMAVRTPEPQSPSDEEMEDRLSLEPQSPTVEEMKDRLSPKKKRPRDRDDDGEVEAGAPASNTDAEEHVHNSSGKRRSSLPMKKRYRDSSQDSHAAAEERAGVSASNPDVEKHANDSTVNGGSSLRMEKHFRDSSPHSRTAAQESKPEEPQEPSVSSTLSSTMEPPTTTEPSDSPKSPKRIASPAKDTPVTSQKAFAASGFASMAATGPSPFATLAGSNPSIFGGSGPALSAFGTLTSQKESTTTSAFGASTAKPTSVFGSSSGLAGGFGGAFGRGFSAGFGTGQHLSSFAAAKGAISKPGSKKVKAFGAPDSSEDEASEDDRSGDEAAGKEENQPAVEEKKKTKAPRAPILDGEEDEMTLCQVRAKLFALDERWKERGVGNLRINVPRSSGAKLLSGEAEVELLSFPEVKPCEKAESEGKAGDTNPPAKKSLAARLIMRQEHTHRVILNSVILKDQVFHENPTDTAICITFMAFEDGKPAKLQFKMNATNGKEFLRVLEEVKTML